MKTKPTLLLTTLTLLALLTLNSKLSTALAQGTAFTYQGDFDDGGSPASGIYDLRFTVFDSTNLPGNVVAGPLTNSATAVSNGLFIVTLDFGPGIFTGPARWLEIGVRTNGNSGFSVLAPRQLITPVPYAIMANSASNLLGGLPAGLLTSVGNTNSGTGNFFIGPAGNPTTSGYYNTANGFEALNSNTIGSFNTANGVVALHNNTSGTDNTANGADALYSNTTGTGNTATGMEALEANTNGVNNTATGFQSLYVNTSGSYNTANGAQALFSNLNGSDNTAYGNEALYDNTSGDYNAANGYKALFYNTSGGNNTASGYESLYYNTGGNNNTADGDEALNYNTSGSDNTALGYQSLYNNSGGSFNIAIGVGAGAAITTGNNNIDIGNAGYNNESDTIRIGTSQTKAVMLGIYGTTIATGGTLVYVNPSGLLGTATSSARFKQNIRTMAEASDVLLALHPVTFQYKPEIDPNGTPQFGLIAEEVEKVDPALVVRDDKHQIYSVRYEAVNAMLLNEFPKEHKTVEEQTRTVQEQGAEIQELKQRLEALEKAVLNQKSN